MTTPFHLAMNRLASELPTSGSGGGFDQVAETILRHLRGMGTEAFIEYDEGRDREPEPHLFALIRSVRNSPVYGPRLFPALDDPTFQGRPGSLVARAASAGRRGHWDTARDLYLRAQWQLEARGGRADRAVLRAVRAAVADAETMAQPPYRGTP